MKPGAMMVLFSKLPVIGMCGKYAISVPTAYWPASLVCASSTGHAAAAGRTARLRFRRVSTAYRRRYGAIAA